MTEREYRQKIISTKELKEFKKINNVQAVSYMLFDYFCIFLTIYLSEKVFSLYGWTWFSVLFYILSVICIASRMNALYVLVHDAVHYVFVSNRTWNEFFRLFISWSLFRDVGFIKREQHFAHHAYLGNPEKDPDFIQSNYFVSRFTRTFPKFIWFFVSILIGIKGIQSILYDFVLLYKNIPAFFRSFYTKKNNLLPRFLFVVLGLSMVFYFGFLFQFFLYWLVPLYTYLVFIVWIRLLGEHFNTPKKENEMDEKFFGGHRTVLSNFFGEIFIVAHNMNYHLEHHLFSDCSLL